MSKDLEQLRAENARLREAQDALINIVEGIGVMSHGTWRNDHGKRLKDTREWVRFYNTRDALSADLAPVADAWQPIETAPRDGTRFLAFERWNADYQIYECWWGEDFGNWEGWRDAWDSEPEPTHWMPLPKPPSGENGND